MGADLDPLLTLLTLLSAVLPTSCSTPAPPRTFWSEATTVRIQALPLEQLKDLAEALLDFSGPTDLQAWLDNHAV